MFDLRRGGRTVSVTMDPDLSSLERFCAEAEGLLASLGLDRWRFQICLLIREAVGNVIRHGCQGRGTVRAGLTVTDSEAVLTVEHDGPGWDWRSLAPALPPATSCCGRGLFILHSYSDSVAYNGPGTSMTVTKRLAGSQGVAHEHH